MFLSEISLDLQQKAVYIYMAVFWALRHIFIKGSRYILVICLITNEQL